MFLPVFLSASLRLKKIAKMFLWKNPVVYQRLGFRADVANQVAPIIQNAGLYNYDLQIIVNLF
ncbi:hypothetical protein NSTC745_01018 [Nostoc sp. DSM 114161]|jgi:hypothetical protein